VGAWYDHARTQTALAELAHAGGDGARWPVSWTRPRPAWRGSGAPGGRARSAARRAARRARARLTGRLARSGGGGASAGGSGG
jgi:hypothetical protein